MRQKPALFTFDDLLVHAEGKISAIFGQEFSVLDGRPVRIRMPSPPLLLLDRILELSAKPGIYEGSYIVSETDLTADKWYLADRYIPTGVYSECCQGLLLLLSILKVDFLLDGSKRFRFLGSRATYYGGLPGIGDRLQCKVTLNRLVVQEGTIIVFFRSQGYVDGKLRMQGDSNGGFFTHDEIVGARGVLWDPVQDKDKVALDGPLLPPVVPCKKRVFEREELEALSKGRLSDCFGPEYNASGHQRTPRLSGDGRLYFDRVASIDLTGGPWGRGYLRAEWDVDPGAWFFPVHFKNDPVMPGTLMLDGCLQAMGFYLLYMGFSLNRDGHHFEPVSGHTQHFRFRGQVHPETRHVVYEVFVQEIGANPNPYVLATVQAFADGLKIFYFGDACLQLAPDDRGPS